MQVKLKVMVGKSSGKEIPVPVSRFLIGRAKDCHMRPKSDSISRNHCAILTKDGQVVVRDLNSRNGTLVNGTKIKSDTAVQNGDHLKVGKLELELLIQGSETAKETPAPAAKEKAAKKPSAKKEKAASKPAAPPKEHDTGSIDFDVSEWLEEADAVETERRQSEPDTRQFQLDETDRIALESDEEGELGAEEEEGDASKMQRPEKKPVGKLPERPSSQAATSRDAAADMLKKFFNNR